MTMWEVLKNWNGAIEINGVSYATVDSAMSNFKVGSDSICIKLSGGIPKAKETPVSCEEKPVVNAEPLTGEIKITVKKYMTEPASVGFDFMEKWNNNVPMPLRTMTGTVLQETKGMVKMRLHGVGKPEIHCMRCGRELTNPVSRHYGIGPECMSKIGFVGIAIDDIETIREKLQEVTWEGWVIKSAIIEREEV